MSVLFMSSPAALAQASGPAAPAPTGAPGYPAGGYPPSYPPPGAPATQQPRPGFAPVAGPVVQLVTNHPRARLQEQLQLRWTDVCAAPCGIAVNPAATYRVAGGSLRPTNSFSMPRPAGAVLVDANMGSNVKHWVGVGLTIGGGVGLLWGGIYLIVAQNVSGNLSGSDISKKDYFTAWGIGTLIVGAILAGVGLPLAIGGTSSVEVR